MKDRLNKDDYIKLFENSYHHERHIKECPPESKLEWIGSNIFGLVTYEGKHIITMTKKCLSIALNISKRKPSSENDNLEYYTYINMPFFIKNINWGTSIRGVWFEPMIFEYVFWSEDGESIPKLNVAENRAHEFFEAMLEFFNS